MASVVEGANSGSRIKIVRKCKVNFDRYGAVGVGHTRVLQHAVDTPLVFAGVGNSRNGKIDLAVGSVACNQYLLGYTRYGSNRRGKRCVIIKVGHVDRQPIGLPRRQAVDRVRYFWQPKFRARFHIGRIDADKLTLSNWLNAKKGAQVSVYLAARFRLAFVRVARLSVPK